MSDLEQVASECSCRMEEIEGFFKPGAQVTLIVRAPGFPDRDFMLTNDTVEGCCNPAWETEPDAAQETADELEQAFKRDEPRSYPTGSH